MGKEARRKPLQISAEKMCSMATAGTEATSFRRDAGDYRRYRKGHVKEYFSLNKR